MSIQALDASCVLGKLALSWEIHVAAKSLLVSVATDSEFTTHHRLFLIPPDARGIQLDVGNPTAVAGFARTGTAWYARIGALVGDEFQGVVDWSGVHGPTPVVSGKSVPKEPECVLSLLHTQAVKEGLRLHTGYRDGIYALLDYGTDPAFRASLTKTVYAADVGNGYHDCFGLDTVNTYSVRLRTWGSRSFATNDVKPLSKPVVAHAQHALKPGKPTSGGDLSATRAGTMVVNEAREQGRMRFATSADYMRYLSAKAKTSEGRKAV
jgi:hypothetical protein